METYFGPEGLLAKKLPGYEYRQHQTEMARAVYNGIKTSTHLIVEAGTGTGKTLAYLIPAILSGKQVVVSTGTKTLQDQILDHDIPFLKRLLFPKLHVVCLKGRRNYLCLRRFNEFIYQPSLWKKDELRMLQRLQHWAQRTKTGDRADIPWLPDHFQVWNELTASSNQCLGSKCENFSACFLMRLRLEASEANIVVVNHHLFFADLSLRNRDQTTILPEYDAVIFDEAHQLEDIVSLYLGLQFSSFSLIETTHDLLRISSTAIKESNTLSSIKSSCDHLQILVKDLFQILQRSSGATATRFSLESVRSDNVQKWSAELLHNVEQLRASLASHYDQSPLLENCTRSMLELARNCEQIVHQESDLYVYWCELHPRKREFSLYGTPINVASFFRQELLERTNSVILTSATLSVSDGQQSSFNFIQQCLGFSDDTPSCLFPSPFDYSKQVLIYIPASFPEPHEPGFCAEVIKVSIKIIMKTKGRALFLFTSYKNLEEVYAGVHSHLPYPVLVQGQKPKRALLADFKEKVESVLFATYSFWEGVDVPGDSLSCVLIDKLPFEVPSDPIVKARIENIAREGRNPFYQYQIPRAIIHLKQGMGRLVRSSNDRGIIVLFDSRLYTKSYGKLFLQSLSPMPITRKMEDIDPFFAAEKEPARP